MKKKSQSLRQNLPPLAKKKNKSCAFYSDQFFAKQFENIRLAHFMSANDADHAKTRASSGPVEEAGVHYFVVIPAAENGDKTKQSRIGIKRYAGLYCNRCHVSLLKEGEESARYAGKVHADQCALCSTPSATASKATTSGTISECSCFDWHMAPHRLQQCFAAHKVIDSYGASFTVQFFIDKIVGPCPIQFYDKIEH
jgi:hypothetical protein